MAKKDLSTAFKKKRVKKFLRNQQVKEARNLLLEICHHDASDYDAFNQLAKISAQHGAPADAESAYKHALTLRPDGAKPLLALGQLYREHGRLQDAEPYLLKALQLSPSKALSEYIKLGTDLQRSEQLQKAVSIYTEIVERFPNKVDVYNNRGVAQHNLGHLDEALKDFNKCLELDSPNAHIHCNIGNVYVDKDDREQVLIHYQKALQLDPHSTFTLGSLAAFYHREMRLGEAMEHLNKAIEIDPEFSSAYWNRSQLLLLLGKYKQGWREYEMRLHTAEHIRNYGHRKFSKPQWSGEEIGEKRLLIYCEQGHGDSIQFCRYLPLLKKRVENIIFECRSPMLQLMNWLPGDIPLIEKKEGGDEPETPFDYQLPLMSLPHIFATELNTVPADVPYLTPDEPLLKRWHNIINRDGFKVGLAWAGSPTFSNDHLRSLSLKSLLPLLKVPGITFYSLQKGNTERSRADLPEGIELIDLAPKIDDFADTAAAISRLDLVISVDTAVAHLAGALAKPVWLFTYTPTEWRWLLDREDCPWYPTMRLFRQKKSMQWQQVIDEMVEALQEQRALLCE